jgi:predicted DNA-binding transcriptional regulator AlpA
MAEATGNLLTLTEVSNRTGISMPTLQRYKKLYQKRIPSIGKGRSQRYPEEALDVFHDLKRENIGRRGRPRKNKAAIGSSPAPMRGRKPAAVSRVKAVGRPAEGLLTLTQVSKLTNISYPTLLRYVKTQIRQIPHKGTGRSRRFLPEAVEVFKMLRGQSRRGRRPKSASGGATRMMGLSAVAPAVAGGGDGVSAEVLARIKELEKTQKRLEKDLIRLRKQLAKPFRMISPIK